MREFVLLDILYLALFAHVSILRLHPWMACSYCSDRSIKIPLNTSMETSFLTSLVQLYL